MTEPSDPGAASRSVGQNQLLNPGQIDDVANALLVLARELWVVKDRQRVLETLLADHGVIVPGEVSDHQPGAALASALETERNRYTTALMAALCPATEDAA